MEDNKRERPVGGNQVARAFAWSVADYLDEDGEAALFLPAMTLFEDAAVPFRRSFFTTFRVNTVVNLSNLAEVLSAGRFRLPAAALFYEQLHQSQPYVHLIIMSFHRFMEFLFCL